MKVTVDIPDKEWAAMLKRAETEGIKVSDMLRAGIRSVMPKTPPTNESILRHVLAGFPDAVIAERLGLLKHNVAKVRQRAGLPANRFSRSHWSQEFNRSS